MDSKMETGKVIPLNLNQRLLDKILGEFSVLAKVAVTEVYRFSAQSAWPGKRWLEIKVRAAESDGFFGIYTIRGNDDGLIEYHRTYGYHKNQFAGVPSSI